MEKNKSVKRMDWRQKVLISILGSFIVILSILFCITYHYFVKKIETGNEKVVLMTFEQAEKNLKNVLENAELCLDKYVTNDLIWDYKNDYPETDVESNKLKVRITDSFIDEMAVNRELSALGFLRGDGWGIVSSAFRKNRTGNTQISGKLLKILRQSKDVYPYTTWLPSWELNLNNDSPLRLMTQNASLIGIKALGENSELEKDGYLIVAVSESNLQSTYRSVAFDDSTAVLVDGNNQIISNVGEDLLGEQLETGNDTQNIEYALDIYDWKLCDMIPKQEYMKDAKDIRNFGVLMCLAAILSTVFVSIVWSRKYTRPIELLMRNMHHVRRQEFEIDKPQKLGWEELDQLNEELYYTAQSIKDYIERLKLVEKKKTEEELLALQYQMNPHFLLNSLNSIRWMAMMTNNKIVADTLVTLGKIITPMLRNPSLTWKIENEIEFLENYVAMMQLRFSHDMEYNLSCSKECYDLEFPRLILQPLIENCFVHGSSRGEIRTINVIIECDDFIDVKVINSGVFFTKTQLEEIYIKMQTASKASDHIGMSNVYKRLNLLYGDLGKMTVESNEKCGFIVEVSFPKTAKCKIIIR
ncbi:sensor histidine kinase [Blautia sp.]|uniref:sensor histidine kinase n=1 Tax=Blautia sp. TaxID=1955243 RepID=UPI0025836877|nr:histidine kinase [Blautia sp.]